VIDAALTIMSFWVQPVILLRASVRAQWHYRHIVPAGSAGLLIDDSAKQKASVVEHGGSLHLARAPRCRSVELRPRRTVSRAPHICQRPRLQIDPADQIEFVELCFMCTIKRSTIETLVSLGWLRADNQEDLAAIVKAFRAFVARALEVARNERP
jgi:hypothetical protein